MLLRAGLFCAYADGVFVGIVRPLCKAIPSQLALFSFERFSLKAPIFEGEGTSNEEVVLRNLLCRYMGTCVELYRMVKNAI